MYVTSLVKIPINPLRRAGKRPTLSLSKPLKSNTHYNLIKSIISEEFVTQYSFTFTFTITLLKNVNSLSCTVTTKKNRLI